MQTKPAFHGLLRLIILVSCVSIATPGVSGTGQRWYQITLDNDVLSDDDDGYTGGIGYGWGYSGFSDFSSDNVPNWIHRATRDWYISTISDRQRAVAYAIEQKAFIPDDIDSRALVVDDRPYVGMLTRHNSNRWQVFLFTYARYVANDVTIDGNTFEDSHSVDLEHGQVIASLGAAYAWTNWSILASYQWGTDEFEEQRSDTEFGTLNKSYRF